MQHPKRNGLKVVYYCAVQVAADLCALLDPLDAIQDSDTELQNLQCDRTTLSQESLFLRKPVRAAMVFGPTIFI